jgi:hypothetical protein
MTTLLEVRQDSLTSLGDGNTPPQALLRMGIAPVASKWDLFALQGRMFNLKQTTIGTAVAGSAQAVGAIVLTAPTVRFSVPVGTTVFPRHLNISFATAAGTDNEIALAYTDTSSYTSGGTAITPLNWRTDAPRATVVTSCVMAAGSAIVEAALTNVRAIYQDIIPLAFAFATSYDLKYNVDKWFNSLIPIVGPASVLLFVVGATTTPTVYFSLDWAEVPTVSAITAV